MWLIRTKLGPPAPTDRLIARHALRKRLPAVVKSRLTLVHAPAGFGKTSLLAEWQRCLHAQGVRTAWLSVDEDDSEPLQFFAYLTAALETAGIVVGNLGATAARGFPDVPVHSIVTAIARAVARSGGRTVVLIDDFQRLRGSDVDRALLGLMREITAPMSFVIAARERPLLAQAADPAAATHLQIGTEELRFSGEEARRMLGTSSAGLSEEHVERFLAQTDGWAIALATARQWLDSGWHAERVLDALKRPGPDLTRYLTDRILLALTAGERQFLQCTALVDRFSADLASTLCPDAGAAAIIAALERKDLIVVHWDGGERWYRYHRLLSETVVEALAREDPAGLTELHGRAALWFFEAGHHPEAVRHATATGDASLLARLFERAGGWRLIISGNIGLVRNALARITVDVLREYPRSHLGWILMLGKQGHIAEARREFRRFTARVGQASDALLQGESAIIEACLLRYEDAPVSAQECSAVTQICAQLPIHETVLRATAQNILTAMQFERGDFDAALNAADDAVAQYRAMHSLFGEVFVYVHQGAALIECGRLRDAEATLRQAWRLALDTTGPNTETEAVAGCMLATALHERGEHAESARLLGPSLAAIERGEGWFELFASGYSTAAGLARRERGVAGALEVLGHARQVAAERNLSRLEEFVDVLELRERTAAGETGSAPLLALEAQIRARLAQPQAPRLMYRMQLALARLALERREITGAIRILDVLVTGCRATRHQRLGIAALLQRALAHAAFGQQLRARQDFEQAVSAAMFENYRQTFCEAGRAVLTLAEVADGPPHHARLPRVRDRFLRGVMEDLRTAVPDTAQSPGLSDRERAVLRLLADGLSNKAIARTLQVSDNTVKFHLKNIFGKLGVGSRAEAVRALAVRGSDAAASAE